MTRHEYIQLKQIKSTPVFL